jgi:hypothetical protein
MNIKVLNREIPPYTTGDESPPKGNGFQPDAQIMRAPNAEPSSIKLDNGSFESKIPESDKKEQVAAKPAVRDLALDHDHSKATNYLAELTASIKAEHGQEKLNELYKTVDEFRSDLFGRGVFASGVEEQFGICAEDEAEIEKDGGNVDFAMLVFLCLTEETFGRITSQSYDSPFYGQILDAYSAAIDFSYDSLGQKGKVLVDDLYEQYIVGDHDQDFF